MAIVDMKKLTLVAYGKDKHALLKTLEKTGVVEVQRSELIENTFNKENLDRRDEITSATLRLQFVFDFLKTESRTAVLIKKSEAKAEKHKTPVAPEDVLNVTPKKKKFINPTPRIGFEKFYEIEGREDEIMSKVSRLEEISRRYADIKAETNKLCATIDGLSVYSEVAVRMSAFCDTAHTSVVLGVIDSSKTSVLEKIRSEYPVYIETMGGGKMLPVAVVALKSDADKVFEALNVADFVKTSYNFDVTASEKIAELEQDVKTLNREKQSLLEESLSFEEDIPDFKQLYDYYTVENARLVASDGLALTKTSFVLEGWFPKDEEEKVVGAIKKHHRRGRYRNARSRCRRQRADSYQKQQNRRAVRKYYEHVLAPVVSGRRSESRRRVFLFHYFRNYDGRRRVRTYPYAWRFLGIFFVETSSRKRQNTSDYRNGRLIDVHLGRALRRLACV